MTTPETDLSALRIDRDASAAAAGRGHRRRRAWLIGGAVLVVAAGAGAYLAGTAAQAVETGTVTSAYPAQGYTMLNATGYVVAQRKAAVGSKATGRLEWLGVREGSVVKAGEVVARIESRDVTAQMEQAAANVKVAQANLAQGEAELRDADRALKRSADLLAKTFVSQAAHDQAIARQEKAQAAVGSLRAAVGAAQATYRAAQVSVDQTQIRAPFDGVVLTKNANVGDNITPFSAAADTKGAVLTMADMSTLEVEADVSESNLAKVKVGQPCEIQLDALPDVRFRGVLQRLVPTVDRAKATVMAKVRFDDTDPRILPEMSAKVAFLAKEIPDAERTPRTAVLASAVVERDGRKVAFVVDGGRVREVAVRTGSRIGDLVEVAEGLKAGDKVVLRPPAGLRDGARLAPPK
jgi:RND family efflux transporter MFP subunit